MAQGTFLTEVNLVDEFAPPVNSGLKLRVPPMGEKELRFPEVRPREYNPDCGIGGGAGMFGMPKWPNPYMPTGKRRSEFSQKLLRSRPLLQHNLTVLNNNANLSVPPSYTSSMVSSAKSSSIRTSSQAAKSGKVGFISPEASDVSSNSKTTQSPSQTDKEDGPLHGLFANHGNNNDEQSSSIAKKAMPPLVQPPIKKGPLSLSTFTATTTSSPGCSDATSTCSSYTRTSCGGSSLEFRATRPVPPSFPPNGKYHHGASDTSSSAFSTPSKAGYTSSVINSVHSSTANSVSPSAYEGLVSVSQVPSNSVASSRPTITSSVAASQIAKLEGELAHEKAAREMTQHKLRSMKRRQDSLLEKLRKAGVDATSSMFDEDDVSTIAMSH